MLPSCHRDKHSFDQVMLMPAIVHMHVASFRVCDVHKGHETHRGVFLEATSSATTLRIAFKDTAEDAGSQQDIAGQASVGRE